ncbi:MAG: beta-mannanase precursor [uncultured bacterium]|uniref:GH26 domain-containing protein n=1 Tax=candidate division WWE3 bacterium RBG_16_37_10 TaxID=1802610 RepID=A0A1F4V3C2_UNCKA|nr:MAG: beta-mannanase precursor [uncultured bacterium]OGC51658.1 MAG: hypothetical protein A2W32_01265 [candidate division WWE3 bacterium RBG_16_37_10]
MKSLISSWWKHFLILTILIAAIVYVVAIRRQDIIFAWTWGFNPKDYICDVTDYTFSVICRQNKVKINDLKVNFGVYDPGGGYDNEDRIAIQHLYISWVDYSSEKLLAEEEKYASKNRWMLVTVEPWPYYKNGLGKETLFSDVKSGSYDKVIDLVCNDINKFKNPSFIRWGHEMENVTERYPWAQNGYSEYIEAYRYFVSRCRSVVSKAYYIWSPVGMKGLEKYWPGSDYVDYIGLSVYGFNEQDKYYFGRSLSFNEIFSERYNRVNSFGRPIMIAEMAVNGSERHKTNWYLKAFNSFNNYPELMTVVLFNSKDVPGAWGAEFPVPDWTFENIFNKVT